MQEINRLKRDKSEVEKYRMKLLKNGNEVLAYKMLQKMEYIEQCIQEMYDRYEQVA
mgnify:CR=1 FL=1